MEQNSPRNYATKQNKNMTVRSDSDQIQLNVGGKFFYCSKNTLISFSRYFASMFSNDWHRKNEDHDGYYSTPTRTDTNTYFIDQDPDAFQVLLNYMRNGFIKASTITETVLVQAEFLGIDSLICAVKCTTYRYLHNYHSQQLLTEEETCHFFDDIYGGILSAIHQGILPQSIQPSPRGYKEYAHLAIPNDAVVMPPLLPMMAIPVIMIAMTTCHVS